MKTFWEFFTGLFTSDKPQSSKRFFGAIGFLTAVVYIGVFKHDLIETLLFVSAALIGLETITKAFKK